MTLTCKVGAVLEDKEAASGGTYVFLSRCTDINNLYIGNPISYKRVSSKITEGKAFKKLIVEERELLQKWKATILFFGIPAEDNPAIIGFSIVIL